jgi:hypothetical protein
MFDDEVIPEEMNEWLDAIQASAEADLAGEQYTHDLNEAAKLLAGDLI